MDLITSWAPVRLSSSSITDMLEKIVKYRVPVMVMATLLLLGISYRFSLQHTVKAYREQKALQRQLGDSGGPLVEPQYLERKLENLGRIVNAYKTDTTIFRNTVVNAIALIAQRNQVQLTDVPVEAPGSTGDERVILQRLVLKGEFFPLLQAYEEISRAENTGYLRSAAWKKKRSNSSNLVADKDIILEIYLTGLK
jgi:hypothetical protein